MICSQRLVEINTARIFAQPWQHRHIYTTRLFAVYIFMLGPQLKLYHINLIYSTVASVILNCCPLARISCNLHPQLNEIARRTAAAAAPASPERWWGREAQTSMVTRPMSTGDIHMQLHATITVPDISTPCNGHPATAYMNVRVTKALVSPYLQVTRIF